MTSILFEVVRIYDDKFKHFYLRNKKKSWIFCIIFKIYIKFWIFWKKADPHSSYIFEIKDCGRRRQNNV